MNQIKLGIIGSGTIVQEFLPMIADIKKIEIVGIQGTERSMERVQQLCQEYKIDNAWRSFEELTSSEVNTVYIAVPNYMHFMYCRQALEKGLNVIVEKPITSNYDEFLNLEKIAKDKKCFLFEAVTTLYFPGYKKIQEWLPKIGKVKLVQAQFSQYSRRYDEFQRGNVLPVFDPSKAGGALMDLNIYNLHFVMGLFGVSQQAEYYANVERGIDTSGIIVLRYKDFQVMCLAAKDSQGNRGTMIQGTEGIIKTEESVNLLGTIKLEMNDGRKEEFNDRMSDVRAYPEFQTFVTAIENVDYEFCYDMLDRSKAVCKLQTDLRLKAGILFPMDKMIK